MDPNRNPYSPDPQGPQQEPPRPSYPVPNIDDNAPRVSAPSKKETIREIVSTIGVLIAALMVAFALIAWVFQSYEVDGPSMETTLQNRDRLIVWKVPRTMARITNKPYIPKRADIIIFIESGLSNFGSSENKQLIKRVVGLPGDRVVVKNGTITVYNQEKPGGFNPDKDLAHGQVVPEENVDRDIDVTLADNQIFVAGDNRPNSLDSRTFGPIEADQIVGKLSLRLLPVSKIEKF